MGVKYAEMIFYKYKKNIRVPKCNRFLIFYYRY